MKIYNINEAVTVPSDTNIYFSISIVAADTNTKLAGYTIADIVPPGTNIYYGFDDKTEVKDKKIGRGSDINNQKLSVTTALSKFTSSKVTYKITIEAGDNLLIEKEIDDSDNDNICVYSIIQFKI